MFKKILSLGLALVMTLTMGTSAFAQTPDSADISNDVMVALSESLSDYFEKDDLGNINFTASLEELVALGISTQDAQSLLSVTSGELTEFAEAIDSSIVIDEDAEYQESEPESYGFVGLILNLGPKIRGMNGVVAGAFAGGFVGWHLKAMAAAGPWGAGAAAAITVAVSGTVGYAVTNGLRVVSVGVNIPGVSWSSSVDIP